MRGHGEKKSYLRSYQKRYREENKEYFQLVGTLYRLKTQKTISEKTRARRMKEIRNQLEALKERKRQDAEARI